MMFSRKYHFLQAFRCAGLSASQQSANSTPEHQKANQDILRSMANDLIEQYFLPTVRVLIVELNIKIDESFSIFRDAFKLANG